jgi:hypothetical protein
VRKVMVLSLLAVFAILVTLYSTAGVRAVSETSSVSTLPTQVKEGSDELGVAPTDKGNCSAEPGGERTQCRTSFCLAPGYRCDYDFGSCPPGCSYIKSADENCTEAEDPPCVLDC